PLKARGHADRKVRHVVGDVQKKRPGVRLTDEAKRLLRISLRQRVRIDGPLDLLKTSIERDRWCVLHERPSIIMRVRQSEKVVESMRGGIEFRAARKI